MLFQKSIGKLSLLALCSTSFVPNQEFSKRRNPRMSPKKTDYRILVAGGSLLAKESGIHSTCELLTVSSDGKVQSAPFASLTTPRRGANCVLVPKGENAFRVWIIGGCTAVESSIIRHLDSGEYFDYDFRDSFASDGAARDWKRGSWSLFPQLLIVGRSCFSTAAFVSQNSSDDFLLVLGGWNGVECLTSVECIRSKVGDSEVTNKCSPLPQTVDASTMGGAAQCASTIITPTTATADDECVSTADLISPIKNGCALVLSDVVRPGHVSLLLIGGWDGKRTLNTIFRYTFSLHGDCWKKSFQSSTALLDRLLPYAVECHASVLHNNEAIYVIGGFDGLRVLDSVIRIDLKTDSVTVLPTKLAVPRECHCAEILVPNQSDSDKPDSFLVLIGGWDGYKALRSVEVFRIADQDPYLVPINVTDDALLHARNRACSVVLPT